MTTDELLAVMPADFVHPSIGLHAENWKPRA